MDSDILLLAGLFGAPVRCVKPVLVHPDEVECDWPYVGDLGRVVGLIQDGERLSVLVKIGNEDYEDLTYARFSECFEIDPSRRRFKALLV